MKRISNFLILPLLLSACGSGLNIAVWRGDHKREILQRKVVVDKKETFQWFYVSDPYFSNMQCVHDSEMDKINKLYQRAKKAGVKMDDL